MKKVEGTLLVILILSLILNLFLVALTDVLILMSSILLSFFYFLFAYLLLNGRTLRNLFQPGLKRSRILESALAGVSFSYGIMGLLFTWLHLPGGGTTLTIGMLLFVPVFVFSGFRYRASRDPFYKRVQGRTLFFGVLGGLLLLLPEGSIRNFKYRDYPAYLEAVKEAEANPSDKALWEKVDREAQKIGKRAAVSSQKQDAK